MNNFPLQLLKENEISFLSSNLMVAIKNIMLIFVIKKLHLIICFDNVKLKDKVLRKSRILDFIDLSGKRLILHPVTIFFYEILCTGPEIVLL